MIDQDAETLRLSAHDQVKLEEMREEEQEANNHKTACKTDRQTAAQACLKAL